MAEGRPNAGIAEALFVTESPVEKHIRSDLLQARPGTRGGSHRRVLAVLAYLRSR